MSVWIRVRSERRGLEVFDVVVTLSAVPDLIRAATAISSSEWPARLLVSVAGLARQKLSAELRLDDAEACMKLMPNLA